MYISFSNKPPYIVISREVPESGRVDFIKAKAGIKTFFIDALESEYNINVRVVA